MFSYLPVFLYKHRKPGMAGSLQTCVGNHKSFPLFSLSFLGRAWWVSPSHHWKFHQVATIQKKNYSFPMDAVFQWTQWTQPQWVHLYAVTLQLSTHCLAETVGWYGRIGDPTGNTAGCEFLFTPLISVSGVINDVALRITKILLGYQKGHTFDITQWMY